MSLMDDYFDVKDAIKNKSKYVKKQFDHIWDYSIKMEEENTRLYKENRALKDVIQIKKGE